jgi:quinol monooxygenase YgiN
MSDADSFLVLEKWESRAAFGAHLETPHLKAWRAALLGAGLVSRDLVAIDAAQAETV